MRSHPADALGHCSPCTFVAGGSEANATIPAGLQLTLQDADANFLCKQPLGYESSSEDGIDINNRLVSTSNKFQASPDDRAGSGRDCNSAVQSATAVAVGFQSLWGGVTFCMDAMQLV